MKRSLFRSLYFQVLVAIAAGVLLGVFAPATGAKMKPLGDGFIKLIKMIIAPIIFCTVVLGISGSEDLKKVGRTGGLALLYFEVVSTLALIVGLIIVNVVQPGAGMNVDVRTLDSSAVASYAAPGKMQSTQDFLLNVIPATFFDAFARGEILQVLFLAVLFGVALQQLASRRNIIFEMIEKFSEILFAIVGIIMKAAPVGAFGAMAFTVGAYGVGSLLSLAKLMATFYATCLVFIFLVLGSIARVHGFNIFRFLRYIKEELLIVLGTSSSEAALPRMMAKMERLGAGKSTVGLVIPTGYSFNLDGTSIYLTMAAVFIAQATNAHMNLTQQLTLLAVLLLTSKGAAGVTGSGFVVLAATLSAFGGAVPVGGLALILGIDRLMSEARALTNVIGNGVAAIVIAKWTGDLDTETLTQRLREGATVDSEPSDTPKAAAITIAVTPAMKIRTLILTALVCTSLALAAGSAHWVVTWGASPAPQLPDDQMRAAKLRFDNQTLREIVHTSIGSDTVRVRLSNAYGKQTLEVGSAHIALRGKGADIVAGSDRVLTFSGRKTVSIPPDALALSDPVKLNVPASGDLAVSIYLPKATMGSGVHYGASQTSYIGPGDLTGAASIPGGETVVSWVFLTGVDVLAPESAAAVVAFGDSITDGARSTVDTNRRWPNILSDRLQARNGGRKIAVLDAGIGGNRILHDASSTARFGVNALARFDRDVLAQPGVKYVIVLEGINDLGHAGSSAPESETVSAEDLIAGMKQMIERAHEKGIKVFGGTVTPFEGTVSKGYFTPEKEAKRKAINEWIRNGRAFDGVVDFEKAVRDPKNPTRILATYDSGDHLHPGDAGYKAMGEVVDLSLFK